MEKKKVFRVNVYRPLVECQNCDLRERIPINYGTPINIAECPNCKCKHLRLAKTGTAYNIE